MRGIGKTMVHAFRTAGLATARRDGHIAPSPGRRNPRGSQTLPLRRDVWSRASTAIGAGLALLAVGLVVTNAWAGATKTTQPPLRHMTVNLKDKVALRTGAIEFMHRCSACHSLRGTRLVELAKPLGLSDKQLKRFLDTTGRRLRQTIVSPMPTQLATKFLHKAPPDLTVIAKRRSPDWLYTYLTSFYVDPSRPTGTNNVIFYNVAMPDVFASLQGLQAPVKKMGWRFGNRTKVAVGVKPLTKGAMSQAQFDQTAKDLVSFLYLVAHPHQRQRYALGPWILGLLGLLAVFSYLLYRVYWRRVVRPDGPRWWHYWRKR